MAYIDIIFHAAKKADIFTDSPMFGLLWMPKYRNDGRQRITLVPYLQVSIKEIEDSIRSAFIDEAS